MVEKERLHRERERKSQKMRQMGVGEGETGQRQKAPMTEKKGWWRKRNSTERG